MTIRKLMHLAAGVCVLPLILAACVGAVDSDVDTKPSFGSKGIAALSYPARAPISGETLPKADGGDGTLSYTLAPIPPGLSFDPTSRQLTGTPTAVGIYAMIYRVADEDGDAVSLRFTTSVHHTTVFWTNVSDSAIRRTSVDGSGTRDLVTTGLMEPHGITLDAAAEKILWTDCSSGKIQRGNLDGTVVEDLVLDLTCPRGIVLDTANDKMYWTEDGFMTIQRANLDGTGVEALVTSSSSGANRDLALDTAGGKIYWTDTQLGNIQRANLDGSEVEELLSGLMVPRGIALDLESDKVYWAQEQDQLIRRANLDGSGVEDLVTVGLESTTEIELDIPGGKMYWADHGTSMIQRANLDGSDIEDIDSAGPSPEYGGSYGIALY